MIIDANNLILGKLAAKVAKLALNGEKITIINCANAVVTGKKEAVFEKYKHRYDRRLRRHGPFFPRISRDIMKRTIRGMLDYKKARGAEAFKRIICYSNIPKAFIEDSTIKIETFGDINISNSSARYFVKIGDIATKLGGKE